MFNDLVVGCTRINIDQQGGRYWKSAIRQFLRQQAGSNPSEGDDSAIVELNLHDIEMLPHPGPGVGEVIPGYLRLDGGVFFHHPRNLALRITEHGMDVWCGPARRDFSLSYLLQTCLSMHGGTLVHAAAISRRGRIVLVPGFGGVGKTAFTAAAMGIPGTQLYGDDLISIGPDGLVYAYKRPFALYPHHSRIFPDYFQGRRVLFARIPAIPIKLAQLVGNMLTSKLNLKYLPLPKWVAQAGYVRVPPQFLFDRSQLGSEPLPIKSVYLLTRTSAGSGTFVSPFDPQVAVDFMVSVIYHELHSFSQHFFSWLAALGVSPKEYFAGISSNLAHAIDRAQGVYKVGVPEDLGIQELGGKLVEIIFKAEQ